LFSTVHPLDGVKKSGSSDGSKDDIPDSVATAYQVYGPRSTSELESTDPAEKERRELELEEEAQAARRQAAYTAMFSSPYTPPPPTPQAPAEPVNQDPRSKVFSYRPIVARSERNKIFGSKGLWKDK
jgi:hypothetical protein